MSDRLSVPSYRLHKQSGQAVVTLTDGMGGRHDILLGRHGTAESRAEYARVIGEWEAAGRRIVRPTEKAPDLSMNELMVAYLRHAEAYYVKDGAPTSEPDTIKQALRFVKPLYGHVAAKDFGPLALKAVRQTMVEHPIVRKFQVTDPETGEVRTGERVERVGLARRLINKQMDRIKRMFAWAVEEELVPASVHQALICVRGLRKGAAREKAKIKPVAEAWVEAVLPLVPPTVKAMVEVQRLAGMRPQEVVLMRPVDIDMTGPVWEYRPHRYKTEQTDRERIVFLGPKAQAVLRPWLPLAVEGYVFSPARSEDLRNAEKKQARKSPMTPSQAKRGRKARPRVARGSARTWRATAGRFGGRVDLLDPEAAAADVGGQLGQEVVGEVRAHRNPDDADGPIDRPHGQANAPLGLGPGLALTGGFGSVHAAFLSWKEGHGPGVVDATARPNL